MNCEELRERILLLLVLLVTLGGSATAQQLYTDRGIRQSFHEGLLADQVNIATEIRLLDSIAMVYQLQEELDLYPAFDLYHDIWVTNHVNPYASHQFTLPDSMTIDVTKYAMPANYPHISSSYGWRRGRMHKGIDLKVYTGDTIYAAFPGKIRVKAYERRGYGHYIVMRHSNGLETVYGHMSKILVDQDQLVKEGEPIGLGGSTGRSTGSHLHFEVRLLGQDLDPADIFDFKNRTTHTDQFLYMSTQMRLKLRLKKLTNGAAVATHRVKSGDTLIAISKHYGVSVNTICRLNNMTRTTTLKLGRVLMLEDPI